MNTGTLFFERVRWTLALALVLGMMIALPGCSRKPPENAGAQFVRNKIKDHSNGRMRLVHFKKTNGEMLEEGSFKLYRMDWEAQVEFVSDCCWREFDWDGHSSFSTWELDNNKQYPCVTVMAKGKAVRKGQHVKLAGTSEFEKTEMGWRGQDARIY